MQHARAISFHFKILRGMAGGRWPCCLTVTSAKLCLWRRYTINHYLNWDYALAGLLANNV
jgi:hypothetical protein